MYYADNVSPNGHEPFVDPIRMYEEAQWLEITCLRTGTYEDARDVPEIHNLTLGHLWEMDD